MPKLPGTAVFCALALALALSACAPSREATPPDKPTPGVSGSEIVLGSSLALKGHASYLGTQTLRGAMAYLSLVNEQGGIFGRRIRVIAYDDSYDPPSTWPTPRSSSSRTTSSPCSATWARQPR